MVIGVVVVLAVLVLIGRFLYLYGAPLWTLRSGSASGIESGPNTLEALNSLQELILTTVAVGLAAATAIELAYTLFTAGPDEALDPVMLGLAGAIILQLATMDDFQVGPAVGLLLSVAALGGLFAIRRWISELPKKDSEAEPWHSGAGDPRPSGSGDTDPSDTGEVGSGKGGGQNEQGSEERGRSRSWGLRRARR